MAKTALRKRCVYLLGRFSEYLNAVGIILQDALAWPDNREPRAIAKCASMVWRKSSLR